MVSDINIRSGLSKKDFIVARPMEAGYLHFKKNYFSLCVLVNKVGLFKVWFLFFKFLVPMGLRH